MMVQKISFILLGLSLSFLMTAQSSAQLDSISKAAILSLHEGALVIRLKTNHKKIAALQAQEAKAPTPQAKERAQMLISETVSKIESENRYFVSALAGGYTFSNYYLMYDYDIERLKAGEKSGFFLNDNLEVDPTIQLVEENYLTMYRSKTAQQKLDAYIVTTQNLENLKKPFPYYFRLNSVSYFIDSVLFAKSADNNFFKKLVAKINRSFQYFYEEVK